MFYLCILLPSLTSFESLSDVVGHVEMLYIVNFDQTFGTRRPSTVNSLPALEMFMPSAFGSSACLKVWLKKHEDTNKPKTQHCQAKQSENYRKEELLWLTLRLHRQMLTLSDFCRWNWSMHDYCLACVSMFGRRSVAFLRFLHCGGVGGNSGDIILDANCPGIWHFLLQNFLLAFALIWDFFCFCKLCKAGP